MNKINQKKVDQLGIITSGLCAVHCAALPLLISLGLLGSMQHSAHDTVEIFVIGASSVLGLWSIYNGLKGHGKLVPQFMIGAGALTIVFAWVIPILGHPFMALGGCLLLIGHWINWRQLSSSSIH